MRTKTLLLSLLVVGAAAMAARADEPATIQFASSDAEVDVFEPGARLFTDRAYTLAECPAALNGARFVRMSINQTRATVLSAGLLTALTPDPTIEGAASVAHALERDGFRRIAAPEQFQLFGKNAIDRVRIYRKQVTAGTKLYYGKWCVLLGFSPESRSRPKSELFASEILPNGIRLEADPRDRTDMAAHGDKPLPVPYLAHPPAVIPVDLGRQLFVDDFLIEKTTLVRSWHKARKDQRSPVMMPETPLELGKANGHAPMAAPFSGGVWYDGSDRLFKAWYCAGWFDGTAYATSTNGIDWTRPNLDIQPGSNRVIPAQGQRDSAAVILDPDAPAGGDRFKMLLWGRPEGGRLHLSKDGVHWGPGTQLGPSGDRSTIFYNPFRKTWVYSIRGGWHHRSREYAESVDYLGGATLDNRVKWLRADHLDRPADCHFYAFPDRTGPVFTPCLYNFDAVAYESLMLGGFTIMTGPENNFCAAEGVPKMTEIHLGFSRDGFHWSRPDDRTPFIPGGRAAGRWDRAYLHSNAALCLVMDDELWFYYTGFAGDPERKGKEFATTKNGMYSNAAMGIARLRRDGFASMDADASGGTLETRPIRFSGMHLFVNVDVPEGELSAEVLDLDGKPIEPFTAENCAPVAVDKTRVGVSWRGAKNLAALAGKPVRLRFILRKGSLYSFWLSKNASGKSGGYLAGGGPGYKTLRDE